MNKVPYTLMKNPTQSQLLAMIHISKETLKDFDFMVISENEGSERLKELSETLPICLLPFFQNVLDDRGDFDRFVDLGQKRINSVKGLSESHKRV